MTVSESLVKTVNDTFDHETISTEARVILSTLVSAYINQVKATLRLESTIHKITKEVDIRS
jgi:hypothetical protein